MTRSPFRSGAPARRGRGRALVAVASSAVLAGSMALVTVGTGVAAAAPRGHGSPQAGLSKLRDRTIGSVVAPNGDNTPYGLAVVPKTVGRLTAGDVLVVDFTNRAGVAAGGTSILQVNPSTGTTSVFFAGAPVAGPVGVAINPVNDGVWIGDYGSAQDGAGANDLLIAPTGKLTATFTNATTHDAADFTGVWGQGVSDANGVSFYWGNAGNAGTGTGGGDVWRLTPHPTATTPNGQPVNSTYARVATGQAETPAGGNAATAAGPQGLAFDQASGVLYETNDANNTLYAIPDAATANGPQSATVVYHGPALDSPENVVIDPATGNLLVVNAGDNTLVEITPTGRVVAARRLAPRRPAGALFGLATGTDSAGNPVIYYDNDNTNTLHELVVPTHPQGHRGN